MRLGERGAEEKGREEGEQCELPFPELCPVRCESCIPRERQPPHPFSGSWQLSEPKLKVSQDHLGWWVGLRRVLSVLA